MMNMLYEFRPTIFARSTKSFRIRSYEFPCFFPKNRVCNPFRIRSYGHPLP